MGLRPLLIPLLLVASVAVATPPEAAPTGSTAAAPAPPFTLSADLRDEYLAGQPVVVSVGIRNDAGDSRTFPDLSRRPHLVKFEITKIGGRSQTRYSAPPEPDLDHNWRMPSGTRRDVLLEVPSGEALPTGDYTLAIRVVWEGGELSLPARTVRVVQPNPVAASGPWHGGIAEKVGLQTVWVHSAAGGAQLYLHVADAKDPRRTVANYFLAETEGDAAPVLTWSLPVQAWARHVYWRTGRNGLAVVQLQGPGRPVQVQQLTIPWPDAELLSTGVTDGQGGLHVPVWIPSPKGGAGEIKIVSWHGALPKYRSVAPFQAKPEHVTTTVDSGGNLRVALHHGANVDLYTLDTTPNAELPARGLRVAIPDGAVVVTSRFATLPTNEETTGGLALFLLERVSAEDGTARLRGRWVSTSGQTLRQLADAPLPAGQVSDVLPLGADGWTMIVRGADGNTQAITPGRTPVPLQPGLSPELLHDTTGQPWLRSWTGQAAVVQKL